MANEIRIRRNNISGTTTDNPLLIGATTINSPGFVDLPVIDTTNHLILILDPLETTGAAEIVQVTAHTAASSVVTVIRGAEGSTPRQHALGTTWFHGPVASDFEQPPAPIPSCRVHHNASQNLLNNTTVALAMNSERYDTASMHDTATNNSRITFPYPGVYLVTGNVSVTGETDYTSVVVFIRLNGTINIAQDRLLAAGTFSASQPSFNVTTLYKFALNDYIELCVIQENTSANAEDTVVAANTFPEFAATWVAMG